MSSMFGNAIKISVFGQSSSEAMGVTIDGLPAGFKIDKKKLKELIARRAPGQSRYSTTRKEDDEVHFICGLVNGVTCGVPVTALIYNKNVKVKEYDPIKEIIRPGHVDYPARVRFHGFQDVVGGGHNSGRLTSCLCVAGELCRQLLFDEGVRIDAHIKQIYNVEDVSLNPLEVTKEETKLAKKEFAVISDIAEERMKTIVAAARKEGDSLGGIVECRVIGMPAGVGSPNFDGVENRLSQAMFAIPAIKGIEFGNGFASILRKGSDNNDQFTVENGKVATLTNRHGGILGGMTSGMPILFKVAVKPTPSVFKEQQTVRMSTMEVEKFTLQGRHDPCVAVRAVPIVESVAAIVLYDMLLESRMYLDYK